MKLIASTLAAIVFAGAAVAIAQPNLQPRTQPQAAAPPTDRALPWQKHKNADAQAPEFATPDAQNLSCELMADGFEEKGRTSATAQCPEIQSPGQTSVDTLQAAQGEAKGRRHGASHNADDPAALPPQ